MHRQRAPGSPGPRGVGAAARSAPPHVLLALQRAAGNQAVARALHPDPPVVQRATRDDLLAALREAIRAGEWQEVATRLNGFWDPDIVRLSAGLSVGEAANTRAAVATYLAGWPQEKTIIKALDRGRAEVARIGKIYQAYQQSVRDANWSGAVRRLHAMSKADIDERLRKLAPDSLRALCAAAPQHSERVAPWALAAAEARGIKVPDRLGLADDPYPGTADGEQSGMFSMSNAGLAFLARHEGVRLKLYNDSEGHCTIGVGHLVHRGHCNGRESQRFRNGLTHDEVMEMFREDVGRFEAAVSNAITSRINQYQFDALVSFCFNVGIGGFSGSGVLRRVNARQYSRVPAEMMQWVRPAAIQGRRSDEAALFRAGRY